MGKVNKRGRKKLSSVPARETAGRDTGKRYKYQYRHAAEAALELLDDSGVICVYCDFHDDFVVERKASNVHAYDFTQVKTKGNPKHEWTIPETFGINEKKKTPKGKSAKSFAGKLFYHHLNFSASCRSVSILTNVFFVDDVEGLIKNILATKTLKSLRGKSKDWFDKIATAYSADFGSADPNVVFDFLKRFHLKSNSGPLEDPEENHFAIFSKKIYKYSEVELTQPEATKIARSLVELVERQSVAEIPVSITEAELKKLAGITLTDLLSILSISQSAYESLRAGGDPKAIRSTSRLQRLFGDSGGGKELVGIACDLKVQWDAWLMKHRHLLQKSDLGALTDECGKILIKHSSSRPSWAVLKGEISSITSRYAGKLPSGLQLTDDLIFGLFLSLVVKEGLK